MNYEGALDATFMTLDSKISSFDYSKETGSTCCVVLMTADKYYCANAGDSRAILVKKGSDKKSKLKVVELSEDHKPDNSREERRINAADHFVSESRVDGSLALSRALGDFQYKDKLSFSAKDQAVTAKPDIKVVKRTKED